MGTGFNLIYSIQCAVTVWAHDSFKGNKMLNKNNERELAYVVTIDDVTPIKGYDRVELAHVGGWTVVVGKGEFKKGDPAIYFEIDSKLPEVKPFTDMEFLSKKHYKIKTQKMCKSISQGLLMSATNFGWGIGNNCDRVYMLDTDGIRHYSDDESRFLTQKLGVTYYEPEDNFRKANIPTDKYKKMAQRNGRLFSKQPFRWLMKREWGKKLLFVFFGRKKDNRGFPAWVVKTDEPRIQNMIWILEDKRCWVVTEKIDGSSTTMTLKKGRFPCKDEFLVCSRNVCFDTPQKAKDACWYDSNVYIEMAEKYGIREKMEDMLRNRFSDCDWITIQGETYGSGIQKRDYSTDGHNFMAFNFVTSKDGRWGTLEMRDLLEKEYGIPCVPVVDEAHILPDTVEELLEYADGKSVIDGGMREGLVFRSQDGSKSFKAVSNEYLLKYHG